MSKHPVPDLLMVDAFCGAGGVTTGARASGICRVVAGINHDPVAIASHAANHPDTHHFIEDIRTMPLDGLTSAVARYRRLFPSAKLSFWASLECTQFSKAKGGKARKADSRMLAWSLPRYITVLDPDYIQIENVEEFMSWGELDAEGKPISKREGREYIRWVKAVCAMGYVHDWRILNAADFGAYTSRSRFFCVFHKPGLSHAWPQPTHARRPLRGNLFADDRLPWKPVADVLDFGNLGTSIFGRKRPIADKTILRILKGLQKYLPPTQMEQRPNVGLLMTYNSPGYCLPLSVPAGAVTTKGHKAIVTPLLQTYYNNGHTTPVGEPARTVTTRDRIGLVSPVQWLDRQFSNGYATPLHQPAGSLLTTPKMNLCSAFLVNPQFQSAGSPVTRPAPTVIASQRSWPLSVAFAWRGQEKWAVQDDDSEAMRELKQFMRDHQVADIFLRMLDVDELKAIQGFPPGYILKGTKEHQKKFIGNAVVPEVVAAWLRAISHTLRTAPPVIL